MKPDGWEMPDGITRIVEPTTHRIYMEMLDLQVALHKRGSAITHFQLVQDKQNWVCIVLWGGALKPKSL